MSELTVAVTQLLRAQSEYSKADAYARGTQPEVFTSARLARIMRSTVTGMRVNFASTPIAALQDKLEIAGLVASTPQNTSALNVIWTENQMPLEIGDIIHDTLKFGDSYLTVWPDLDDGNFPILYSNSPLNTRMIYDPERPREPALVIKMWERLDKRYRVDLLYPDRIERLVSRQEEPQESSLTEDAVWEPYLDEQNGEDGVLENPYQRIPVFHLRLGRPYGTPVHAPAYGAQDIINKHVALQTASSDFQGFPQRYLLSGLAGSIVPSGGETADDDDAWADEELARPSGPRKGLESGPGSILEFIGENLKIGEFQPASPSNFLEPIKFYVQAMSTVTQTPLHLFEGMGDVPSGESLRAANAPLDKKARTVAANLGAGIAAALEFAMEIVGIDDTVSVNWRPPETFDDKEAWEAAKLKLEAGVPFEQVMREAGYADDMITEWSPAPTPQPSLPTPPQPQEGET